MYTFFDKVEKNCGKSGGEKGLCKTRYLVPDPEVRPRAQERLGRLKMPIIGSSVKRCP